MIGNADDDFVSPSNGSPIQMVCKWPHRASINDDPPASEMISLYSEIHKFIYPKASDSAETFVGSFNLDILEISCQLNTLKYEQLTFINSYCKFLFTILWTWIWIIFIEYEQCSWSILALNYWILSLNCALNLLLIPWLRVLPTGWIVQIPRLIWAIFNILVWENNHCSACKTSHLNWGP